MTSSQVSLGIIFVIVAFASVVGILAGMRRKMDLEQWTVGSRGFGMVLLWLLMTGESFTTFTLLGASGWAYSKGAPIYYLLAYCALAYVVSFFILPAIWEHGQRHRMQTQPDFFAKRYGNKWLTAFVALLGLVSLIPYLQLQIKGLGLIVHVASFDGLGRTAAMGIGCAMVTAFVFVGGIRAVAWVGAIKDFLLLGVVLFVGIAIPVLYFGGIGDMFDAVVKAKPEHFVLPGSTSELGHRWFVSTVLLSALSFYMWPHLFPTTYTAKSGETLRRNAILMPLYSLALPCVFLVGFSAIALLPREDAGDLSLLTLVQRSFPAWFLGVVGGAGALTAMVPSATLLLTASTLVTKSIVRALFMPSLDDARLARISRWLIVPLMLISLGLALSGSSTLVALLLLGYSGVAQFFPGVVLGLFWEKVTRVGVFAGMLVGVSLLVVLMLSNNDPCFGLNAGFIALCVNGVVTVAVSLMERRAAGFDPREEQRS